MSLSYTLPSLWPNFVDPVFLESECGVRSAYVPSPTALGPDDVDDRRLSSISASVDWAKANNLLGIFMDADLLVRLLPLSRSSIPFVHYQPIIWWDLAEPVVN